MLITGIPAVSVPIRLSKKSLPLSLQLMGPHLSEGRLLNIALWIEREVNFQNKFNNLHNQILNCTHKQVNDV